MATSFVKHIYFQKSNQYINCDSNLVVFDDGTERVYYPHLNDFNIDIYDAAYKEAMNNGWVEGGSKRRIELEVAAQLDALWHKS